MSDTTPITTTRVEIDAHDGSGSFSAYVAQPQGQAAKGGIVTIQEIFGVNQVMRDTTDHWARQGYVAICPDLFWRQEAGVDITDQSKAEWDKAFSLYQGFSVDKGIEDIAATLSYLRGSLGAQTTGAVGFCLGGLLAYLTATRTDADVAVGYYGVGIQDHLDEAAHIQKPLMLHIAEEDGFVDKAAQAKMHEHLDPHAAVTLYDYTECDHAFARPGGEHFDAEAAKLANARTADFFAKHLGG
ncbi:MAG: dienelactone hydrolase family protein [Pseudomonadota bacterium]